MTLLPLVATAVLLTAAVVGNPQALGAKPLTFVRQVSGGQTVLSHQGLWGEGTIHAMIHPMTCEHH